MPLKTKSLSYYSWLRADLEKPFHGSLGSVGTQQFWGHTKMFKHCRKILFADFFCQLNKNCHLFFFCPIAVACGWNWGRKEGSAKNDPDLKMHWCRCRYRSQFKTTTTTKVGEAHETYNNLAIKRGRPASRASDFVWEVSFHAEPWLDVIFWPRDQQRQQWNLKWLKWWERKCGCVIDKPGVTERSKCGGKERKDYFPNWKRNQTILPANESWRTSTAVFSALVRKWKPLLSNGIAWLSGEVNVQCDRGSGLIAQLPEV